PRPEDTLRLLPGVVQAREVRVGGHIGGQLEGKVALPAPRRARQAVVEAAAQAGEQRVEAVERADGEAEKPLGAPQARGVLRDRAEDRGDRAEAAPDPLLLQLDELVHHLGGQLHQIPVGPLGLQKPVELGVAQPPGDGGWEQLRRESLVQGDGDELPVPAEPLQDRGFQVFEVHRSPPLRTPTRRAAERVPRCSIDASLLSLRQPIYTKVFPKSPDNQTRDGEPAASVPRRSRSGAPPAAQTDSLTNTTRSISSNVVTPSSTLLTASCLSVRIPSAMASSRSFSVGAPLTASARIGSVISISSNTPRRPL